MSKNYAHNLAMIEKNKVYTIAEALEILTNMKQPKFATGPTVELRMKLSIDSTKSDQLIRISTTLPHGTGKTICIAAFVNPENEKAAKEAGADIVAGDTFIDELKASGKITFDVAVAEPDMMKKLAPLARLLGTAGVMPSPKNQTVGTDVPAMIKMVKGGKIDIKNDKGGNLHIVVGKLNKDFDIQKLSENITSVIEFIEKSKPDAVKKKLIVGAYLKSTMSPGLKIM